MTSSNGSERSHVREAQRLPKPIFQLFLRNFNPVFGISTLSLEFQPFLRNFNPVFGISTHGVQDPTMSSKNLDVFPLGKRKGSNIWHFNPFRNFNPFSDFQPFLRTFNPLFLGALKARTWPTLGERKGSIIWNFNPFLGISTHSSDFQPFLWNFNPFFGLSTLSSDFQPCL